VTKFANEQGVEARLPSGRQGAGLVPPKAESDAADPSEILPRWGKMSVPANGKLCRYACTNYSKKS